MTIEVGKLYVCETDFLMLYPDKETASTGGMPVFFIEKNIPLLVLNSKEKYIEVLAGERKGWIIFKNCIKEII